VTRVLSFPPPHREGNPVIVSTYRDLAVTCLHLEADSLPALWRLRDSFDVAAFHWGYDRNGWLQGIGIVLGVWLLRKRIVWHVHEVDLSCRGSSQERFRLGETLNFILYKLADGVVYYTRDARRRIVDKWGYTRAQEVVAVHPPTRFAVRESERAELRIRHGFPVDAYIYGIFGAVRPYKGIPELLDSYSEVRDEHTALVVAGHFDPDEPMPREILEKMLRACGPDVSYRLDGIRDQSIPIVMAILDAVVLPYRTAETSGVFYLAAEFGKPVVAPDRGFWHEVVNADAGVLYTNLTDGMRQVRQRRFQPAYPEEAYRNSLLPLKLLYGGDRA